MLRSPRVILLTAVVFAGWPWTGCSRRDDGLAARLNEASTRVVDCQRDNAALKEEIGKLKQQLAQAMTNPAKVVLHDGEVIELVAKARASRGGSEGGAAMRTSGGGADEPELTLGKGDLDAREAARIVLRGAGALQVCYERALKKNSALQYRAGLDVVLGLAIKPTGTVQSVEVAPTVDGDMTQCMKSAAARWKFPPFAGNVVTLEQKLKLTPKT